MLTVTVVLIHTPYSIFHKKYNGMGQNTATVNALLQITVTHITYYIYIIYTAILIIHVCCDTSNGSLSEHDLNIIIINLHKHLIIVVTWGAKIT